MVRFRKAVLIVHGFTGAIYDNEYLMNYLEYQRNLDVYAWTLPGHNKDRFSNVKYSDWLNFVDEKVNDLIKSGYKKIYVIGHSMGGVLASYVASRHKEIKKLVLINAAFDYGNMKQVKEDIIDNHDFSKYSHLFEKVIRTSPSFLIEFTKIVKKNQDILKDITCETLVLRSDKDEIIPFETGMNIYNKLSSKKKELTTLKGCSHVALTNSKKGEISEYIRKFFKGGRVWKKNIQKEI